MAKKKTKKKKEKKEKKESEEEVKISDKSELEQEVEAQETPSVSRFNQFIQVETKAPILERVTQEEPEMPSLEKGIETTPISEKKQPEREYDETVKYDIESEYQESIKRQREITPDMVSQVAPVPSLDLERVGREQVLPGQEFQMGTPPEMPAAPTSSEEYDIIKTKKEKFTGEKTSFQKGLERRYEFK